jgi:hypothetical protein
MVVEFIRMIIVMCSSQYVPQSRGRPCPPLVFVAQFDADSEQIPSFVPSCAHVRSQFSFVRFRSFTGLDLIMIVGPYPHDYCPVVIVWFV